MIPGITKNHKYTIDGKLTFFGVLSEYYDEIAKHWAPETRESYGRDYEDFILDHFEEQPLSYYTESDYFEHVIDQIRNGGTRRSKEDKFSESVINHFRFLIRRVVSVGAENNVCANVLWGTKFQDRDDGEKKTSAEADEQQRLRTQRSIMPQQMCKILSHIFMDVQQHGVKIALLLMCIFGLRNKEACGVWFEDIMEIPGHLECYVLVVHSSMDGRKRFRKTGGKTDNMYRMIPIPKIVHDYLMLRKQYVAEKLEELYAQKAGNTKRYNIDRLPIACNGDKWWEGCTSSQVTVAGRDLFRLINYCEEEYRLAEDESGFDDSGFPNQKAPTAYLFRREFCTSLYAMGLNPEEIQYLMGHKINNPEYSRRYFRNHDILSLLYEKICRRPLNVISDLQDEPIIVTDTNLKINNVSEQEIRIPFDGNRWRVRAVCNQLSDVVTLTICPPEHAKVSVVCEQQVSYAKGAITVDIIRTYRKMYRTAIKRELMKQKKAVADSDQEPATAEDVF